MTIQDTTKFIVDVEADYSDAEVFKVPTGEYATLRAFGNSVEGCSFTHWRAYDSNITISADTIVHVAPEADDHYVAFFDCGGRGGPLGPEPSGE